MRYKYRYQSGGYIPGISQSLYGMGLQRDVTQAQKDFEEEAKRVEKEQKKRGLWSKGLGTIGKWAGKALGTAFGQGTAGSLIGEGLGTAIGGSYAGKKYDAGDIKKSKTGLFGEDFTELERINKAGDRSFMDYLKGSAGNVGSLISDKYLDPESLGKSLAGKFAEKFGVSGDLGDIVPSSMKFDLPDSIAGIDLGGISKGLSMPSSPLLSLPSASQFEQYQPEMPTPQIGQSTGLTQGDSPWDAGFGDFMASLGEDPYQEGGEVDKTRTSQMAYIDPVDSSIVVMSPEQSKMFDKISNNIQFPAKTSKKYRLETLIDILNNPDLYGMNKKDSSDKGFAIPFKDESNDKGFSIPIKDESNDRGFEYGRLEKYQEGGGIKSSLNKMLDLEKLYSGDVMTKSGDLRFGKEGMITREGLAENFDFPLEEAVFDTLYGAPGSSNMAIDISVPSQDRNIRYERRGSEKEMELMSKLSGMEESASQDFPEDYSKLAMDIAGGDYGKAIEKIDSGWLDMSALERMRSKTSKLNKPTVSPEKKSMMEALGIEDEFEYDSFMKWKKSKGYQQGGMIKKYKGGGLLDVMPFARRIV